MIIPLEKDWGNYLDDIDTKYAHKIFAGKSNEEVQSDFRRCVLQRVSELRFMPIKPFQYYMYGFQKFIEKGDFEKYDSADAANAFITLIQEMLESKPAYIKPILDDLMPTLEHVVDNQLDYGADIVIYGYFPVKLDRIKELAINA